MHTGPLLLSTDIPAESSQVPIDEAVRLLVELVGRTRSREVFGTNGVGPGEEILMDIEVSGSRYILLRMAKPNSNQIRLSPRENEIVRMVAKGHPNKVIADVLNISSWTVCTHLRRIFAKLGVGSRAAMVAQLLELGVLPSEHRGPACGRAFQGLQSHRSPTGETR
jgi:DNA-binding CsgD family transcriptional regulator